MLSSKVKITRLGICGRVTDTATLEFNVKDEVVPESFLDQNKCQSKNLEKVIKKIKKIRPRKSLKVKLKHLGQKSKVIDSLDDLIEFYLDNIMVGKSPIPTNESNLTFLQLKDANEEKSLTIRSQYKVNLLPIQASKIKTCPLLRSLLTDPQSRPLPLGSNIQSVASNSQQYL